MYLTAQNLFFYLRDFGLASADDVVDGGFGVVELGRRNRNFMVLRPGAGSLFVKQVPTVMPETVLSLRREAACAQLALDGGGALGSVAPRLRRFDPARHVLVFDGFEHSEPLTALVRRLGALPEGLAGRMARTLAACHLQTAAAGSLVPVASVLPAEVPWVFRMGEQAETLMPAMAGGTRQVVDAIRATPELLYGMAALGAEWRRVALMHGDLKWENVLVVGPNDGERELRIIDWELADLGEPLWDVGGMLCSFLQYWLLNLSPAQTANPLDPAAATPVRLDDVRRASAEFWAAYVDATRDGLPVTGEMVPRTGRLAGARLVLLAFELLQHTQPAITPHAALCLHLARWLMADPRRAMADLLGISTGGTVSPVDLAARGNAGAADAAPWKLGTLHPAGTP